MTRPIYQACTACSLQNGDGLGFVCAIDLPGESETSRDHNSIEPVALLLSWLGGSAHTLAIVRSGSIHLVSCLPLFHSLSSPGIGQEPVRTSQCTSLWHTYAHIDCTNTVIAIAAPDTATHLYVATASCELSCYHMTTSMPDQPLDNLLTLQRAEWQLQWTVTTASIQTQLACDSAPLHRCATASSSENSVMVWSPSEAPGSRNTRGVVKPACQILELPTLVLSFEFSPVDSKAAPSTFESTVRVLCVTGCDGTIRLYVCSNNNHTSSATEGRVDVYTLAHLLRPPSAMLSAQGSLLKVSWAVPCHLASAGEARSGYLLWLIALAYNPSVIESTTGAYL